MVWPRPSAAMSIRKRALSCIHLLFPAHTPFYSTQSLRLLVQHLMSSTVLCSPVFLMSSTVLCSPVFFLRFGNRALSAPFIKIKGVAVIQKTTDPSHFCLAYQKSLKVSSATNCSRTVCWTMLCPMSSLASCPSALLSGSFCQLSTSGKKLLIMAFSHTPAFWTWPRLLTE